MSNMLLVVVVVVVVVVVIVIAADLRKTPIGSKSRSEQFPSHLLTDICEICVQNSCFVFETRT